MIFNQNIILDYTFDDSVSEKDCHLDWWSFADDDYVQIELIQNDRVNYNGRYYSRFNFCSNRLFLKRSGFGTQEEVIVTRGIKTPNNYYECETNIRVGVE